MLLQEFHSVTKQFFTETERSSEWLPWSTLGKLKLVFNVPSDDQGSHPGELFFSVYELWVVIG